MNGNDTETGLRRMSGALARAVDAVRSTASGIATRISAPPPPHPVQPEMRPSEPAVAADDERLETVRERTQLAEKPHQLSSHGWGEVALVLWEQVERNRLFLVAAGVAFYVMLSLIPAITALVWIFGWFADPAVIAQHLEDIAFLLPKEALALITTQIAAIAGGTKVFTPVVAATMAIALWSANAGMKSLIDAMNLIYGVDEKRSFLLLNVHSMLFTLGALAIFLATIGLLVVIPLVLAFADLDIYFHRLFSYARWPALLVITVVFLTLLNRFGPSRHYSMARWPVWGSTLGAFMWLAVSLVFSFYVEKIGNLAATYGSLAAIIGLMLWLWLSALVVLIGIELNAELERRTGAWEAEMARIRADLIARQKAQAPVRGWRGRLGRIGASVKRRFRKPSG
ncbi:MAG: YihY/virulence factor BrkB family protein [Hyphomicrobiales bacterium]|nr:YihY/virulence factor BrkB family protein [Hyphomicrobiales bacterium]